MTHRPAAARATSAVLLAALLIAMLPAAVAAASPITLEARTLVGGRFEAGGWAAISISLSNGGAPVDGFVAIDSDDGTVRRPVDLPSGAQKQVTLYVRPPSFARTVTVRFEDRSAKVLATAPADVRVLERTTGHVAIVGDGGGNLRPQLISRASGLPEPIPLTAADVPDRPEPLRGIEAVVWADDSGTLTEAQRRSLERWIAAGGQLVVLGGPDWQSRAAAFADLLPVEAIAAVDGASVAPFFDWIGADAPAGTTATASPGRLRPGAVELVGDQDGALFAAVSRGAGRVTWLGIDLATEPFRALPGAALLWSRLLPDDRLLQSVIGFEPPDDQVAGAMLQALGNLPSLEVPPAELLLAVLVGYILLIGPISYLVLRRLDRRELAWITAPLLVAFFSVGTYGLGASLKGSDIILNEIAVIRSTTGGTAASVSSFAGVFSPTRASYDLRVDGDALFSGLRNVFVDGESTTPLPYATEQGVPSHLRGLAVSVFGLEAVRAETVIDYTPHLVVDWAFVPRGVEGRVTNQGETEVEDVAVVSQSGGVMIGTLAPGASEAFAMTLRNLGGSVASEQVYGFSSGNVGTAEERRTQARRQVIDALVGYGGGFPGRLGGGTGGIDTGPFVIGWQVDASPMPIEIDGRTAQRYTQSVEVLSGNPRFGPGPARVEPSQMVTSLVSSAGTVGQSEPGWVTVGEGEAVFQVNLPLEAAGIIPSQIELVAGSDPGIIYYNQGNMQATLPPGYRLSVFDHVAGEWLDAGDLSQRSHFTVEQPTRLLDRGGHILIRVTGSDVADEFGENPVFVGAGIEGVI